MIQVRATTRMRGACALLVLGFALPYWKAPAARLQCALHGMAATRAAWVPSYGPALQRASLTADPQVPLPSPSPLALPAAPASWALHAPLPPRLWVAARAAPPLRI